MAKWTRFERRHRRDFTLQMLSMLRTGFEGGCYEHIPPDKSREDN